MTARPVQALRELLHLVRRGDERLTRLEEGLQDLRGAVAAGREEQGRQLSELRDSVHLGVRRGVAARRPVRALFLVHHVESWDTYDEVVRLMLASSDFVPVVASVPRRFPGSNGLVDEDHVSAALDGRGVAHLRLTGAADGGLLRLVKSLEPDLVFRQSQWDADVADELGTPSLGFTRQCLVPYETVNLVENVPDAHGRDTAVDSDLHRAAWAVFWAGERIRDVARERAPDPCRHHATGHPKVDRLHAAAPAWPLPEPAGGARTRRVLWSAHHTIATGWTDFGLFPVMCRAVLEWTRSRPDVEVAFLPHPALAPFTSAPASPTSREQYDAWLAEWRALGNTAVVDDGDYAPVLAAADVVLTDGLSMLVEPQVVGRPVVFAERAGHRPFNQHGELVRSGVHAADGVDRALQLVDDLLGGPDPLREQQRAVVQQLFGAPGGSAERILDVLRVQLAAEVSAPAGPAPTSGPA